MNRTRRLTATLVATAALVAPASMTVAHAGPPNPTPPAQAQPTAPPQAQPTQAQPTQGQSTKAQPTQGQPTKAQPAKGQPASGQSKQLLKDVAVKDKRLARLAASQAITRLGDESEAALVVNIDEARATLAEIKAAVEAAGSTVDTKAVRKELRSFRVENFQLVVNILKQAEGLADEAATDAEAHAFVGQAEAAALEIGATSTKADLRAVRDLLNAARAELDENAGEDDTAHETDDEVVAPTV